MITFLTRKNVCYLNGIFWMGLQNSEGIQTLSEDPYSGEVTEIWNSKAPGIDGSEKSLLKIKHYTISNNVE